MIKYKFEEEVVFLKYFAQLLADSQTLDIIDRGSVENAEEAKCLSQFFWRMVDASIIEENKGTEFPWVESCEFWNEKLMNSIAGYLEQSGYEQQWEDEVDKA